LVCVCGQFTLRAAKEKALNWEISMVIRVTAQMPAFCLISGHKRKTPGNRDTQMEWLALLALVYFSFIAYSYVLIDERPTLLRDRAKPE
jgi:hypothetical protein